VDTITDQMNADIVITIKRYLTDELGWHRRAALTVLAESMKFWHLPEHPSLEDRRMLLKMYSNVNIPASLKVKVSRHPVLTNSSSK